MKHSNIEPKKSYFLYVIAGVLSLVSAALFFPLWAKTDLPWADWGAQIVNLIIGVCLFVYIIYFLLPKVMRGGGGATHLLVLAEFVLLLIIGLGCFLSQFKILKVSGACAIFGYCLVARGVVEIFRAYYHQKDSKTAYPVWWLVVAIAMVMFGTYCIAKPLFQDSTILWVFVLLLLVFGLSLPVYGLRCKPKKKRK